MENRSKIADRRLKCLVIKERRQKQQEDHVGLQRNDGQTWDESQDQTADDEEYRILDLDSLGQPGQQRDHGEKANERFNWRHGFDASVSGCAVACLPWTRRTVLPTFASSSSQRPACIWFSSPI